MIELDLNEENYSLKQFTPASGRYYERPMANNIIVLLEYCLY